MKPCSPHHFSPDGHFCTRCKKHRDIVLVEDLQKSIKDMTNAFNSVRVELTKTAESLTNWKLVAWNLADPTVTSSYKHDLHKWMLQADDGGEHREWLERHVKTREMLLKSIEEKKR